jgi:hypothetical protein
VTGPLASLIHSVSPSLPWFRRRQTPQAAVGRFYCDGAGADSPDCLLPRTLGEMQFGCGACDPGGWRPFEVWRQSATTDHRQNAGRGKELAALLTDPRGFATARRFLCSHGLKIVARCPGCHRVIDLRGGASPISIVGGVRAGKSALSSTIAHELRRREGGLFAQTGLSCTPRGSASRRYESDVVRPLMEHGELPLKTWLHEYHKAVYQIEDLRGTGWASRSVMLTDVAGEVYDEDVTPAINALRTILLWAREMVFLIDPTNTGDTGGMGGCQAPDHLDDAQRVVAEVLLPTGQIDAPHTGRVLTAIEAVMRTLSDAHWPSASAAPVGDRVAASLARAGFGGVAGAHVALVLEATQRARRPLLTSTEIATWVIQHLTDNADVRLAGGKLPYAVAVAVTKSELIEDELGPEWRDSVRPGGRGGASDWARELGALSAWSKERLLGIGERERELVSILERHFTQVGYFFVSSLNRDTDIRVRPGAPQASHGADEGRIYSGDAGTPQQRSHAAPWWVTSKVVAEGADGSRRPEPIGVLNPLLWLLSRRPRWFPGMH